MLTDWFTSRVPDPTAKVDMIWAWDHAIADAGAARFLLDTDPSNDTLLQVLRNHIAWFRFMAAQHWKPSARARYASAAAHFEARLEELEARRRALGSRC